MKIKESWHLPNHKQAQSRLKKEIPTIEGFNITENQKTLGQDQYYYISTYGCQANERDSENFAGILEACGYTSTQDASKADVILINTCGIRENAANNVLGEVGSYKKYFRQNPNLIIGVGGCMTQEEGFATKLLERYPWVHLIFGTHNFSNLPEYLQRAKQGEKVVEVYSKEGEIYEGLPEKRAGKHKAWVNIMYGCDKFCTYCIVPYTRGKQRSRKASDILEEVKVLKKLGYQEITLLGQNVNAYGKDLPAEEINFATLLDQTAQIGIPRIRFMTSHPWDFSDEMIEVIAKHPNIMPSVHLPLQSGDDEILRRMGRRYSASEYMELFNKIRQKVPGVTISTDIIVGFPNESDEAFENTLDVVRACRFDNAFTFIYSPRPGTPAAKMEDSIDMATKKERLLKLNALWNKQALENHQKLIGQTLWVLAEGVSHKDPSMWSGYSQTSIPVNFKAKEDIEIGQIVPVIIDEAKTFSLNGHQEDNVDPISQ